MYQSLGYFDVPLLLGKGFTFGIAESILWGKDKNGTNWQAVVDGQWIYFAEQLPSGARLGSQRMTHEDFNSLFADAAPVCHVG